MVVGFRGWGVLGFSGFSGFRVYDSLRLCFELYKVDR